MTIENKTISPVDQVMFRQAVVWFALLCVTGFGAGSGQGDPCPSFACQNEADQQCWRRVGVHTDVGQSLAAAGHISAAMLCFTRAANGVQDERWLPVQHTLSSDRRLALSRLYTAAASAMIASGQHGDELHAWLRRAVQISAPSAQVLFEEDEPPDPSLDAHAARSLDPMNGGPSTKQEGSPSHRMGCSPGQADQLIAEGRWGDGGRCLREAIELMLEGSDGSEAGLDQLAGLFFQAGAAGHMASEQDDPGAADADAAFESEGVIGKQRREAERSMQTAMRIEKGRKGQRASGVAADESEEGEQGAAHRRWWRVAYVWPMALGDVLVKRGRAGEAVQCYARALRASPLDAKALLRLTRAASTEAYRLRDADGQAVTALRLLRTVVAMLPRAGFDGAGRIHSDICSLCRLTKMLPLALEHCDLALQILDHLASRQGAAGNDRSTLDRLAADAHFNKGVALHDMKRYAAAAAELRRSATLRPDALDCRLYLGYAVMNHALQRQWDLIKQGQGGTSGRGPAEEEMRETLEILMEAQAMAPTDPNTYVSLAQALMAIGMSDAASEVLMPIAQDSVVGARDPFYQHLNVNSTLADTVIRRLRSAMDSGDIKWSFQSVQPCSGHDRSGAVARSAVAYLTSDSSSDLADLAMSLRLLRSNFFDVHGMYPVIVFHDSLNEHHMAFLQSAFGDRCPLTFQHISLEANAPTDPSQPFRYFHQAPHQGVGYRSMCRFFSGPIFDHEAIRGLDLYMRMDTDSFFLRPLLDDPFKRVRDEGAVYAYLTTATEEGSMCIGLEEEMTKAVGRLAGSALPRREAARWDRSFFYNNFEVTAVQFWRSEAYRAVFNALDGSGGFWAQRWGDGPVRSLAVALMAEPSQVIKLAGISYWHQTFVTLPLPSAAS